MLTIEKLNNYGANTIDGIKRCASNKDLYLRLVKTVPSNDGFNLLFDSIKNNDLEKAFSYAHGLKGILANLSLDPILKPIIDITELLRNKEKIDYTNYINLIEEERKKLENIINN